MKLSISVDIRTGILDASRLATLRKKPFLACNFLIQTSNKEHAAWYSRTASALGYEQQRPALEKESTIFESTYNELR